MYSLLVFVAIFMPVDRIVLADGKVIVECACRYEERSEFRRFVDCMHGPPYRCEVLVSLDGMIIGWLNHVGSEGTPDSRYICVSNLPRCWKFDRDHNGFVNLADLALYLAGDWGTRTSITATPHGP